MKAPAAAKALGKLAERARAEEWSYERFAQALLATETSARDAHGGESRIRAARSPPGRHSRSSTSPSSARLRSR
jgi:DNA replication protein DnaC